MELEAIVAYYTRANTLNGASCRVGKLTAARKRTIVYSLADKMLFSVAKQDQQDICLRNQTNAAAAVDNCHRRDKCGGSRVSSRVYERECHKAIELATIACV